MRSPAAYERLREKVKGPEDLAEEMKVNEALAEFKFALETEPAVQEDLRRQLEQEIKAGGIESLLETSEASPAALKAAEVGNFTVAVEADSASEQVVIYPEGNVSEKIPLKKSVSDRFSGSSLHNE